MTNFIANERIWIVFMVVTVFSYTTSSNAVNLQDKFCCTQNTSNSIGFSTTVPPAGDISFLFSYLAEFRSISRINCPFVCNEFNSCDATTYDETLRSCKLYAWNGQSFFMENFLNSENYCWKSQVMVLSPSTTAPTTLSTTTRISTTISTTTSTTNPTSPLTTGAPMPPGIQSCTYGSQLTTYSRNSTSCPRFSNCTCDKGVDSSSQTGITSADNCFTYCANDVNCLGFSYYPGNCFIATTSAHLLLVSNTDEFACYCEKSSSSQGV